MITVTSVGFGDISPTTNYERLLPCFIVLVGDAIFAGVFGAVSSLIQHQNEDLIQLKDRSARMLDVLRHHGAPQGILARVDRYFSYVWKDVRKETKDWLAVLPELLPHDLVDSIITVIRLQYIQHVPLFENREPSFLRGVVTRLKEHVFLPNDIIISKGDIGEDMFFIQAGKVNVHSSNGRQIIATLNSGDFFGEMAILKASRRTCTISAATYCKLLVLHKADFDSLLQAFPVVAQDIMRIAQHRETANQDKNCTDHKFNHVYEAPMLANLSKSHARQSVAKLQAKLANSCPLAEGQGTKGKTKLGKAREQKHGLGVAGHNIAMEDGVVNQGGGASDSDKTDETDNATSKETDRQKDS
eukprot:GHVQ01041046.1.p1 GENE.GHVQ01041046.1~~GHVQ01041046.1.p1  ORF type:complete len:358 (-),score=40.69 GHVQ01041046.1:1800-2873(-)